MRVVNSLIAVVCIVAPIRTDEMQTHEIDVDLLIEAVIKQESGGSATAKSSAGAKGLMQLMDATGKEWHRILGIEDPYDPYDAEQNKQIGAAYLGHLLTSFRGLDDQVELALASYNGGIGNVLRAIVRSKSRRWALVRNEIRGRKGQILKETQDYVPMVLAKYKKLVEQNELT